MSVFLGSKYELYPGMYEVNMDQCRIWGIIDKT